MSSLLSTSDSAVTEMTFAYKLKKEIFVSKLPQMKKRTLSRRARKPHYRCVGCGDSIFANAMQDMWKTQNVKYKATTSTAVLSWNLRALSTAN